MISGQEQPDSGTITLGETVNWHRLISSVTQWITAKPFGKSFRRAGYYEDRQHRDAKPRLVGRFNFKGVDQGKRVGELSGVSAVVCIWRSCCRLAATCCSRRTNQRPGYRNPARAGKRPLEFPGCAMVISHDRWFLDRMPRTSWTTRMKVKLSSSKVTY